MMVRAGRLLNPRGLLSAGSLGGFTLVELMIVTAVIAILAAIAIPQYQNYVAKTQFGRVMGESGSLKLSIELCIGESRTAIGTSAGQCDPAAKASALLNQPGGNTAPIDGILTSVPLVTSPLSETSTLTATIGSSVVPTLSGKKIVWVRSAGGGWTCTTDALVQHRANGCTADAS